MLLFTRRGPILQFDAPVQNKHTLFVESKASARGLDLAEHFDTSAELLSRAKHRPRRADLQAVREPKVDPWAWGEVAVPASASAASSTSAQPKALAVKTEKARAAKYSELAQREERHRKMGATLERIGIEKALLGKGRVKKLKTKEGELRQYKWRQERKR